MPDAAEELFSEHERLLLRDALVAGDLATPARESDLCELMRWAVECRLAGEGHPWHAMLELVLEGQVALTVDEQVQSDGARMRLWPRTAPPTSTRSSGLLGGPSCGQFLASEGIVVVVRWFEFGLSPRIVLRARSVTSLARSTHIPPNSRRQRCSSSRAGAR